MTIKKIGLSALVAATLTTGAFADPVIGDGGFIHGADINETYNINYSAVRRLDLNTTAADGTTDQNATSVVGIAVKTDEWVIFDLTGAEFDTNAKYYLGLVSGSAYKDTILNVDSSTKLSANKLEFKIGSTAVAADQKIVLLTGATAADNNVTDLILPKGSTEDVTLVVHGEDSVGGLLKNSTSPVLTILKAKTTPEVTGTLVCGENGKDALIDSDDKFKYIPYTTNSDSGAYDSAKVYCKLKIASFKREGLDFSYGDNNISVVFSGEFLDGNFSNDTSSSGILSQKTGYAKSELLSQASNADLGNEREVTSSIVFTSTPTRNSNLEKETYTASLNLFYGSADYNKTIDLVPEKDIMNIALSSYEATIIGMYASAVQVEQFVITNDSSEETTISLSATDQDGNVYGPTDLTKDGETVKLAKGKTVYPSLSEVYNDLKVPTGSVCKVVITLPKVSAKKGDVIVYKTNINGGQTSMKVIDNNGDNNGN